MEEEEEEEDVHSCPFLIDLNNFSTLQHALKDFLPLKYTCPKDRLKKGESEWERKREGEKSERRRKNGRESQCPAAIPFKENTLVFFNFKLLRMSYVLKSSFSILVHSFLSFFLFLPSCLLSFIFFLTFLPKTSLIRSLHLPDRDVLVLNKNVAGF